MNVITRIVYNRPEFFQLSMEYECLAREYYCDEDYLTIFVLEYGYDSKCLEVIDKYPYDKKILYRPEVRGFFRQSFTSLEGLRESFQIADDYVVYIEDDTLIHKSFFQYVDKSLKVVPEALVINSHICQPYHCDDADLLVKTNHYFPLVPIITKRLFGESIEPRLSDYYRYTYRYIVEMDNQYEDIYKQAGFKSGNVCEQDGFIHRIVALRTFRDGDYCVCPLSSRSIHIGFIGKSRDGFIPGMNFEDRVLKLKEIISQGNYIDYSFNKQYNDYFNFSPNLDTWDGHLELKDELLVI